MDMEFFGLTNAKEITSIPRPTKINVEYTPLHSESLSDIIREIQKTIQFTFQVEQTGEKMKIKLFNGENKNSKDTEITHPYECPELYIRLKKRMACGSNEESNKEMFKGNCISGKIKNQRKVKTENPITDYQVGLIKMDNEFSMTLKTKTIKEMFASLNLLERALNIYVESLHANLVDVCGINNIEVNQKLENDELYSAVIEFQVRTKEEYKINRGLILKQYNIMFGQDADGNNMYVGNGHFEYNENGEATAFVENAIIKRENFNEDSEGGFNFMK